MSEVLKSSNAPVGGITTRKTKSIPNGSSDPVFTTTFPVDDKSRRTFEKAAKSLFYNDRSLRLPTFTSLGLLDQALETGNPDALVLKGLAMEQLEDDAARYLKDAKRKGSKHPLLYYALAEYFMWRMRFKKALKYIDEGIGLGSMEGCKLIAMNPRIIRHQKQEKKIGIRYLLDLVGQGCTDGPIIDSMNTLDEEGMYKEILAQVSTGDERKMRMEMAQAYLKMYTHYHRIIGNRDLEVRESSPTALGYLYKALELAKDDDQLPERVINLTLDLLVSARAGKANQALRTITSQFSTWYDLVVYYCDVLINRGSAEGYRYKAESTQYACNDIHKAIKVAKEADAKGLATARLYHWLASSYERIKDIKDYSQAVKYYDKQLGLCLKLDKVWIYEYIAGLYYMGGKFLPRDIGKALHYRAMIKALESEREYYELYHNDSEDDDDDYHDGGGADDGDDDSDSNDYECEDDYSDDNVYGIYGD